ncbi:PREDICTED: histone deacetylase complex subunit SAP130-A isoform X3 [Trachymyrmex septentrionalis]|uniref:histone deacetylase complex subunit SAP130-A isoform X3 n=1 Tax=Trachymyrmex septentrionalis TaxID=34720 RepID=UPI00084F1EAF|nr:PREDICTED: histone deacetylase complex subunit SAP130-A isoform X3 [Trachymyrmex septentrionalis]
MNTTISTVSSGGDKRLPETTVQTVAQNLTTMQQNVQSVQNVQSMVQSNVPNIQPTQTIVGSMTPSGLVGKSVSLDMNPKLSLMKPVVPSGATPSTETSKITTTLCSIGSTVKIISPGMLSTVERQIPSQTQLSHQVTIPTYHVPRGPAAVANISAPRSTVATPIVRTNVGQIVPATRPGNTPISNPQWQPKTSVALYAQPQRHPTPSVSRVSRPSSTVYTGQQPRLITPASQARSVQATMVAGSSSRLIAPVLQTNLTRHPVAQNRPPTPQVVTVSQTSQPIRSSTQTIQPTQSSRPLTTTGTTKRIAASPIVETVNRISSTASVTVGSVEPTVGRQLSISGNTVAGPSTVSHIVIPSQQVQPQQGAPRVVQTVTSLSSLSTSQVITTTANTQSANAMRILQTVPTTVAKIAGMSLHSLPIALPVRAASAPIKAAPTQSQNIGQTVQVKPAQANLRMSSTNSSTVTSSAQPVQGQYIHPPHTTTYLSFETSGTYSQFRQASVQPVRLVVEPGYEEPHGKPNASPRPSILRKRDHDNSPVKGESQFLTGAAKNLVPVLASLPSSRSMSSPPCSPKGDQDGGGCQSSGSTTVSATSSPGLDEELEQSRITINPTIEMSPRKKPRKQQLTGVELTEPKFTEEEMQFLTEEKLKKENKEESKEKLSDKRQLSNVQSDIKSSTQQTEITIARSRPVPSLLGSSWKNKWTVRLQHYRRPSDVRPREERRPTVAELAQQKYVLQRLNGWKIYHLTTQMEDISSLEKQVHEKLKTTLTLLESQQTVKSKHNDGLERVNELIKGNMQRSNLISEGMNEARTQLVAIFQHKGPITDLLQRCGNKRAQKKRDK